MSEQIIIEGDCVEKMRGFAAEYFDLVVTSPPYDELREYEGFDFDFDGVANEIVRVLKPGGVCVWIVNDAVVDGSETGSSFRQALYFKEIGLNIHDTMIWDKEFARYPDPTRYSNCFEFMFVFSKGTPKTVNRFKDRRNKWGGTKLHGSRRTKGDGLEIVSNEVELGEFGWRHNIWRGKTAANGAELSICSQHPAVAPLWLIQDHIATWSNESDSVLDPFMGSGTTLVAAKYLNRNATGIEISPKYCEIARNRLAQQQLF